MKLVKLRVSHGNVKATLLCAFAACTVSTAMTTQVAAIGKTAGLFAKDGDGNPVSVGTTKLSMGINTLATFTLKLNAAGRKLLAAFHKVPATVSFKLTNTTPAKTISQQVTIP